MPTWDASETFWEDWSALTRQQQERFLRAMSRFVDDLKRGRRFRPGLRVKRVVTVEDVYEMTWAPDGRATFSYGDPVRPGDPHIVWRRAGTHEILRRP